MTDTLHATGYRVLAPSGETLAGPYPTRDDALDAAEALLADPDGRTPALEAFGLGIAVDLSDGTLRYVGPVTP